jgi:glycine oxidase
MMKPANITVAGAGVLGLTTALALADAGARVTVCDPAGPGDNASGVAAGMLAPVFEAVLDPAAAGAFDLLLTARNLWPHLERRIGVVVDRAGAVAVGEADWLARIDGAMSHLGVHATDVPTGALANLAPGLSPAFAAGLLTREDWRVDAGQALAALRAAAQAAGVVFRPERATGLEGADRLVIATGAAQDLAGLAPELARLVPIKGHILRLATTAYDGVVVRGQGAYVAPDAGGLILGATMETGVSDPAVDPAQAVALRQAGARLFPEVEQAAFTLSAGIRASTPDGLPLVGASSTPGVLLAVGSRRNGWLLAPLVARQIVACVTEGEAGPYGARLDPARFAA